MGQKAWNIKLVVDQQQRSVFEDAIARWNEGVRTICLSLLRMRRGDYGEEGKAVWEYLAKGRGHYHVLYLLTEPAKPEPSSKSGAAEWAVAHPFLAKYGPIDALATARREVLKCYWSWAIRAARERITSYQEHVAQWESEHEEWLKEKAEWEANHLDYMQLRPEIERFHAESGVTRGRWSRWHKWLEFLQRPEVVDWEHTGATLQPLSQEDLQWANAKRKNAVARQRKRLYEKNPQLERFDKLHRQYERRFARTGRRRNPDGFRHPPTFTLPSVPNRPDWPRLQREQGGGWFNLDLDHHTIELSVPAPREEERQGVREKVRFVADPRLLRLHRLASPFRPKHGEVYEYGWTNPLGEQLHVQPSGIKLIQRGDDLFASISLVLHPPASPIPLNQQAAAKYSTAWVRNKIRSDAPDLELVTCAIDLAVRHLGAVTVAREGQVFARRILHHRTYLPGGDREQAINIPSLAQLDDARRALGRARAKTGGVRRGDQAFGRLRERYQNLKDDRIKKAVAATLRYARHHGAQVVVFEDLQALRPDAAMDRGINRAMQRWNRGMIVNLAKQLAEDYGLRVVTVNAGYTSRLCSQCLGLGIRFDQGRRKRRFAEEGAADGRTEVRPNRLGHWFYCPNCDRRVHADLNASENLHRVFLGTFPKARGDGTGQGVDVDGRVTLYSDVEQAAEKALQFTRDP